MVKTDLNSENIPEKDNTNKLDEALSSDTSPSQVEEDPQLTNLKHSMTNCLKTIQENSNQNDENSNNFLSKNLPQIISNLLASKYNFFNSA